MKLNIYKVKYVSIKYIMHKVLTFINAVLEGATGTSYWEGERVKERESRSSFQKLSWISIVVDCGLKLETFQVWN